MKGDKVIRWDNVPHHREISTYPHHKHENDEIMESRKMDVGMVLDRGNREDRQDVIKMGIVAEYEGKIVLVTGGAGCIGTNLSKKLAELKAKVIILDDLSSAYEWNIPRAKNIVFVKGSVLDDEMLKRVFKFKPDYVFHLAAHFANQNSVDNPETDLMVNGQGILKVLQYANLVGVKRFVYET